MLCLTIPFLVNNSVRAIDSDDDAITDDEFKDSKVTITQGYMSYETKIKICWESLAGSIPNRTARQLRSQELTG